MKVKLDQLQILYPHTREVFVNEIFDTKYPKIRKWNSGLRSLLVVQ